ncbi:MAG TPA: hypothetical protein VFI60_05555 [Candidatus Acidoferrum sp.]|nr:hypothetical protein [Candidatus Acidoferrum sp.]
MTKLHKLLVKLGACNEAIAFANGKELAEAWATCERPDWMMWLCANMLRKRGWPTRQQVVLCACDCAETVLPIFEGRYPKESAPRVAIETARKWVNGEVSLKEVRAAAYTADAAAYATAYSAADAAAYAAYAAQAAYAAAAAADAAARAVAAYAAQAVAAADAAPNAYLGALSSKRKELANLIRMKLAIPSDKKE